MLRPLVSRASTTSRACARVQRVRLDAMLHLLGVGGQLACSVGARGWGWAGAYAGTYVASAGDVDADGHDDILIGAWGDDEGGDGAGAAYLVYGPVTASLDLSSADAKLIGEDAGDRAGVSVSSAGDVDADGHSDLLVGAQGDDDNGNDSGVAYLVYGPVTASLDLSTADARFNGEGGGGYAGRSVAAAGDVDADGYGDLLVGAFHDNEGGTDAGAAYLILFADMP